MQILTNDKETLMIDMDDVIVKGGHLYLINQFLGTNYTIDDIEDYYKQNLVPAELRDDFWDWILTKNVYDYSELLPNAYEVIEELNEVYKLCIGTAYMYPERQRESGIVLVQKHEYLMDTLPFLDPKSFIYLTDKSFLNCDNKIDDRLIHLAGAKRKILFTDYHNKNITEKKLEQEGVKRADDWLEVRKLLLTK